MNISEIQVRQGKIDVVGSVTDVGEIREFDKFGKKITVCNATFKDESGEIILTLWNEEIDKVKVGDKVKVTNGYCNEYQGEKQLTAGKFGNLEVVKEEEVTAEG
jgi:replication factor A1